MVDLHDYDIQCIEHEVLWKYDKSPCDYSECDCLLSLRKDMINKRVLVHQKEILPDIIAFNDALTAALRELYDRAHRIWNSIKENEDFTNCVFDNQKRECLRSRELTDKSSRLSQKYKY